MKMKIVFLTRNYPPTICGVGDHTYHLAQALMGQGVEVHVICSADQKVIQQDDIKVYPVVNQWNTEGVLSVVHLLKNIQPDWFIVQYVPHAFHPKGLPYVLVSLYRAVSRLDISILTIFHEVKIRPEKGAKTRLMSFLQGRIAYKLSNMSQKVVTSIDFYDNNLKKLPHHKKTIIPIASNITPVKVSDVLKKQLKDRYQIDNDAKIICTFGDRQVLAYLPVFDRLVKEYPNLVWLLCGKNSTPPSVLASRNYIHYVGEMSAKRIYQHLSLGNVFFMPDPVSAEGEGGTCNKSGSLACALSLGIPIVGSKGDMNNKLLVHGENILLTDIRNETAIYESFKSCLDSERLSEHLGRNARLFHDQSLRWTVSAEKFLKLIYPSVSHVPEALESVHTV